MQDRSDHHNISSFARRLAESLEKPVCNLLPLLHSLAVPVVFQIIADQQVRPELAVAQAADVTSGAARGEFHSAVGNDLALGPERAGPCEPAETLPESFVILQFDLDIAEMPLRLGGRVTGDQDVALAGGFRVTDTPQRQEKSGDSAFGALPGGGNCDTVASLSVKNSVGEQSIHLEMEITRLLPVVVVKIFFGEYSNIQPSQLPVTLSRRLQPPDIL